MKPMGLNSTHYVKYHDIEVKSVDLFEDAWGLNSDFTDVINLLHQVEVTPRRTLTKKLINRIRKQ